MLKTNKCIKSEKGFTLVELMVTVFLTAIAVISIYRGYTAFSQSADAQQQVMEMQQNLRIGMYMIEKDIRRAGMEEEDDEFAGFEDAKESSVTFNMDLWGDDATNKEDKDELDLLDGTDDDIIEDRVGDGSVEDSGEKIRYFLNGTDLQKEVWDASLNPPNGAYGPPQTIITNVDALNFVYLDEDEEDSLDKDTTPNDPGTGRKAGGVDATDLRKIYSVQVALVVRTTNEDYRYNNIEEYRNGQGSLIYEGNGDNFRRGLAIKQIKIRNAGL